MLNQDFQFTVSKLGPSESWSESEKDQRTSEKDQRTSEKDQRTSNKFSLLRSLSLGLNTTLRSFTQKAKLSVIAHK